MPIYEYQCQDCDEVVEVLQKIADAPAVDCPSCGKPSLKKKISAAAFRLKGSGWYETDFKTGAKKNISGDSADKPSSSSSEKAPASSSDTSGKSKTA
ncbi:MAG: putative FmdB family regulatory protein [Halioglobus sp.]|jgi:putative FmdB family regulatory protein